MDTKIRIRPADIDVPENNPFEHDLLNRRKSAEILTELVASINGLCVIAVDFSVDNICFVIVINRTQLMHSIRALYGQEFDAEGYLRRFFDADFRIPYSDRTNLINAMLDNLQIHGEHTMSTRNSKPPLRWPIQKSNLVVKKPV